jgi:hypothetical protein
MKRKVTVHDIKQALLDERFRASLPEDLNTDVQKFLHNPTCGCNHPIYLRVMQKARKQVAEYFPSRDAPDVEQVEREMERLPRNDWQVINCGVHELVEKLRELGPGRKQLEIARWQEQVTVVVNHIDGNTQ